MAAEPVHIGGTYALWTKLSVFGKRTGKSKGHLRIIGRLSRQRPVQGAAFQIVHAGRVQGAHLRLIFEFHLAAEGIPGNLAQKTTPCATNDVDISFHATLPIGLNMFSSDGTLRAVRQKISVSFRLPPGHKSIAPAGAGYDAG